MSDQSVASAEYKAILAHLNGVFVPNDGVETNSVSDIVRNLVTYVKELEAKLQAPGKVAISKVCMITPDVLAILKQENGLPEHAAPVAYGLDSGATPYAVFAVAFNDERPDGMCDAGPAEVHSAVCAGGWNYK